MTGRPQLTDLYQRFLAGEEVEILPSRGTNAVPIAFNPEYRPDLRQHLGCAPHSEGDAAAAASSRRQLDRCHRTKSSRQAGRCSRSLHRDRSPDGREEMGDAARGLSWRRGNARDGRRARVLRQADRRIRGARRRHRQTLWQFKTGSSVNATAITYTHDGRQYVTIASGRGGLLASRYQVTRCRPADRSGRLR